VSKDNTTTVVPTLRFPAFRDAAGWEAASLGQIARLEYGRSLPDASRRGGPFPVVGSNGIVGYHSESFVPGPAIVVGRKGSAGEVSWIDSACYPIDTTYYVENIAPSQVSIEFLYRLLQNAKLDQQSDPSAIPGLNRERAYRQAVAIPSSTEQQRITACVSSLDAVIAAQGRKVEALKTYKRGLIQQLFPREGEVTPRLRLLKKKVIQEWTSARFGDLLQKSSVAVDVEPARTYREIGIRSHGKGVFHKSPVAGGVLGEKRVFQVVENALVINIVFAWEQAVATTSVSEAGMIASHRFPMFLPKSGACDVRYVKAYLLTKAGKHKLGLASPGGAGRNKTLDHKELNDLRLPVPPSVEEQTAIANCLAAIDASIALEVRKLNSLSQHKAGLMQQLFPSPREI